MGACEPALLRRPAPGGWSRNLPTRGETAPRVALPERPRTSPSAWLQRVSALHLPIPRGRSSRGGRRPPAVLAWARRLGSRRVGVRVTWALMKVIAVEASGYRVPHCGQLFSRSQSVQAGSNGCPRAMTAHRRRARVSSSSPLRSRIDVGNSPRSLQPATMGVSAAWGLTGFGRAAAYAPGILNLKVSVALRCTI